MCSFCLGGSSGRRLKARGGGGGGKLGAERVAVVLYGLVVFAMSIVLAVMWRYAVRRGLMEDDVGEAEIDGATKLFGPSIGFSLVGILVALVAPMVAVYVMLLAALVLGLQYWSIAAGVAHWQTMVFTALTFVQLANVMAIRSERESLLTIGLLSNIFTAVFVSRTVFELVLSRRQQATLSI